ncbi:unnamed protein product [Paramecium sonneborni]|uniref:NUP210 Ig-like domain-containing protein n=1 Tax=Paramecium sonneborni TaxID=65129 RepID=A0A8S1QLS8_9CILI|nr:unnamed protein product [Paramecium sonneborni]
MKFALILALGILNAISGSKISNKNILLPLADIEVEYEITAEGGCFDWSASNNAIIVTGQDSQGCLKSIGKVKVITKTPSQTFIYVKSKSSDTTQFIVEVVVQEISRISIITKQKQLDLDTQEELHVQAYDDKDNTFTTLEGLKFNWIVGQLEMVKFSESGLKVSEKRARLEFNSDIIVVKGKKEGKEKVFASIIEKKYQVNLIETNVDLVVIQKFQFFPDYPVYYLPTFSMIQFHLLRADGKTLIQLPSKAHQWSTTSTISTIDQNGVLKTQTIEKNLNLKVLNSNYNYIQAIYHVVNPKFIDIDIWEDGKEKREGKVTHLIVGRLYRFQAYLKDELNQRIYSTNQEFSYDCKDIILNEQTIISYVEKQNVKLTFKRESLESFTNIHFVQPIQIQTVFKTYIHLPINEQYNLVVNGGSGHYKYQSRYQSPFIFEILSPQTLVAQDLGENILIIYDQFNVYNNLEITVYVTDVSQILPFERRKEFIVKEADDTFYQAIGDPKIGNYTQCRSVKFTLDNFDIFTTQQIKGDLSNYLVCNGLNLLSSTPGQYNLQINTQKISVTQQVRVYDYLHFEKSEYYVTPHSTITTKVFGGPTTWDQTPYNEKLSEGITKIDMEKYHFNCFQEKAQFIITRINKQSDLLPNPKLVSNTLPVICQLPSAFKIFNEKNQEVSWLFKEETIQINIVAVYNKYLYYNSSSLQLNYFTRGLKYQNRYLSYDIQSGISDCKFIVASENYTDHKDVFPIIQSELDLIVHHTLKLIPSGEQYVLIDQIVFFRIESSTNNIQCQYDNNIIGCQKDSVTITPKKLGQFQLVVYDLSLNYSVSATLNVINPSQLNLELSQQITVVGNSINATSFFNNHNKLVYVTNWTPLHLIDNFGFNNINQANNQFIITPNREGLFKLQTQYDSINSNQVDLKVYPKLQAETVYMPTECETHVIFIHYPQFTYSVSSSQNLEASVSQNIVTIKSKAENGYYIVTVFLRSNNLLIDTVNIPVVVNNPNQVILYYGRKVELGSSVRIVANFLIQDHQMNLCLCPTHQISWYLDEKQVQTAPNSMGLSVSTVVIGKINIRIKAYDLEAQTLLEVERLNSYTRNLFINTKALYHVPLLIPTNSKLALGQDIKQIEQLKLNLPNIIESDSITLEPQLLLATTPMLIQVEEIYQMYPMSEFVSLRVDEKIEIEIAYLNQEGYQFEDIEDNKFEVLGYTRHIIQIKVNKNGIEIQGFQEGFALIKLSCGNQKIDYIFVKVGVTLQQIKAYLGSTVTYNIDNSDNPIWNSNCGSFKANLLTIEEESNECFVEVKDQLNKFKIDLQVIRPSHIIIDADKEHNSLNIKLNVNPKIPSSNQVNPNFNITVEIDQKQWFELQSTDNPYEYYIKPIIAQDNTPMPKKVKVNAFIKNKYINLDGSKEITYEREFYLPMKEIFISNGQPIQTLRIPYYRNVEKIHQDNHLQGLITTQFSQGQVEIVFDFSQCHEPTEGEVQFENNQKIRVKFMQDSNYELIIFLAALVFFVLVVMNYFR